MAEKIKKPTKETKNEMRLELNVASSRYSKEEKQRMSDGMVP
ncbi:hypothetical protein [Desulforamulus reducens]|nr:hypothetical protein [Desulforamulus reducens]